MAHCIRHVETAAFLPAVPELVFAHLDDHAMLGSLMIKPSAMMLGGTMRYEMDEGRGQHVGAVIRMRGSFLGLSLFVRKVVSERTTPTRKAWETRGPQRMLVIADYRIEFDCTANGMGTALRVFIDYRLPTTRIVQITGAIFAPVYARWRVSRMARDAERRFSGSGTA